MGPMSSAPLEIPEHLFNRLSTTRSEFVGDQDGTS